MTFKNKNEFYAEMHKLNTDKPWSLILTLRKLSDVFYEQAKMIRVTKTISFKKRLFLMIKVLIAISIMIGGLVILGAPKSDTLSTGFVAIVLYLFYFGFLGGKEPDYTDETYYRRKEISKKVLIGLESYLSESNQKIRNINSIMQAIWKIDTIDGIKTAIKGDSSDNHPIDYMNDEGITKYWEEVYIPKVIKDRNDEINKLCELTNQLEKEIEFCKNIK